MFVGGCLCVFLMQSEKKKKKAEDALLLMAPQHNGLVCTGLIGNKGKNPVCIYIAFYKCKFFDVTFNAIPFAESLL